MSSYDVTPRKSRGIMARIGHWLSQVAMAQSRRLAFVELDSLSDEELAKRGLERQSIARYVWRDRMQF